MENVLRVYRAMQRELEQERKRADALQRDVVAMTKGGVECERLRIAAETRCQNLQNAVDQASYALNPNQGETTDWVSASMWLRTTLPPDHPNYVSPDDPSLSWVPFAKSP